jgi:hypothetical protein
MCEITRLCFQGMNSTTTPESASPQLMPKIVHPAAPPSAMSATGV